MILFERATFLRGVIAAQSRNMPAKLKASPQIGGVQKKVTATIFGIFKKSLRQIQENIVFLDLTRGFLKIPKIVAVFIFFDTAFPSIFFLDFDPTSGANNSTLKTARPKKYHIFGILGT